jgi:pimeloyl-ACP methyl ester carboxylesterase
MTTFVLVDGGWGGGWSWGAVRRLLQADGHDVHAVTLTGLGERSHLLSPAVGLDTHIQDVVNVLHWEDLRDVVLVGQSYGGFIITAVADRMPDRIGRLLYLDADIPEDGDCLASQVPRAIWPLFGLDPESDEVPLALALPDALTADLDPWAQARVTAHPTKTFFDQVKLTGAGARIPTTYIHCTEGWAVALVQPMVARAKARGWNYVEIASVHDAHVADPELVARILTSV